MKPAIPNRRRFDQDRDAVSVVIGAILVFGVFTTVLITMTLRWAPIWQADAEAVHSVAVEGQFVALNSRLWQNAANHTLGEIGAPLSMGQGRSSVLSGAGAPGTLEFAPDASRVRITAPSLAVLQDGGKPTALAENQWQSFPGSLVLSAVSELQSLRLRVADVSSAKDGRAVTVALTDGAGALAGSYRLVVAAGQDLRVVTEVRNGRNEVVNTLLRSFPADARLHPFYLDVLDPAAGFDQVLGVAAAPLDVQISYDPGFDADYAATYLRQDAPGSSILFGSGGTVFTPYNETVGSGSLQLVVRNTRFPGQSFTLENGGIIVEQSEGAVFRVNPAFDAFQLGASTGLSLQLPALEGDPRHVSGNQVASVRGLTVATAQRASAAPYIALTFTTSHPSLWASFLSAEMQRAGLTQTGTFPEYTTAAGPSSVTLTVYGRDADPASATNDVFLNLVEAKIRLSIKA